MHLKYKLFSTEIRYLLLFLVVLLHSENAVAKDPIVLGGSQDNWKLLEGVSATNLSPDYQHIRKMDATPVTLQKYPFFPMGGVMMQDVRVSVFSDMDNLSGDVIDPFCGKLTYDSHFGVDSTILTFSEQKAGVPVFAVLGGSIIEVGNGVKDGPSEKTVDSEQLGNYIAIDHGNGHVTRYLHLRENSILVNVGDVVEAGQQIGLVGSSGVRYWPPHLTFQTLVDGKFVEPFKGDCNKSESLWWNQDSIFIKGNYKKPYIGNFVVTQDDLSRWQGPPSDTSRTGTFVKGLRRFGIWFQYFNFDEEKPYEFRIKRPNEEIFQEVSGTLYENISGWWALNWNSNNKLNFNESGDWEIELIIGSSRDPEIELIFPIRVVSKRSDDDNRPPNPIEVEFIHGEVSTEDIPVCRIKGNNPVLDPDFDFVRFRYNWTINGKVKRTFTSGARSDALPKGLVKQGDKLECKVTPLDANVIPGSVVPKNYPVAVAKSTVFTPFSAWASAREIKVDDYHSDPDSDGYNNATEYLLDRDPKYHEGHLDFSFDKKTKLILVSIPKTSDPRALFTLETCTDLFLKASPRISGAYEYDFSSEEWFFKKEGWEVVPVSPTRQRTWLFGNSSDTKRFFNIHTVLPDEPIRTVPKNKILAIP